MGPKNFLVFFYKFSPQGVEQKLFFFSENFLVLVSTGLLLDARKWRPPIGVTVHTLIFLGTLKSASSETKGAAIYWRGIDCRGVGNGFWTVGLLSHSYSQNCEGGKDLRSSLGR